MPSLKEIKTLQFSDTENTLGIVKNSSSSFFVAYIKTNKQLMVQEMLLNPSLEPSNSLNVTGKGTMSPALVNLKGTLYLFYREDSSDLSGDKSFKYNKYINSAWTGEVEPSGIQAGSDHNPIIVALGDEICMIYKRNHKHFIAEAWMDISENWTTNDNKTYWISDDDHKKKWGYQTQSHDKKHGGEKQEENQILSTAKGNPITPRNPSMTIFNEQIFATYKGGRTAKDKTSENLYLMTTNSMHQWTNPVHFLSGEKSKFAPTITSCNGYLICVFARDGHSDHLYYSISSDGSTWTSPEELVNEDLDNHKATDPFVMHLGDDKVALSYVTNGKAKLTLFSFS